ncbi:uncharacterized protein LOC123886016 [Trifolium pratense]|uniref:uncharacterized protein LOC123886016 n=1 Tax=Trifolium pratense TaxID=57577 RepID=UPI001E690C92|nr:uncharacterized protein LOC123886016 [Trifolium pratense]
MRTLYLLCETTVRPRESCLIRHHHYLQSMAPIAVRDVIPDGTLAHLNDERKPQSVSINSLSTGEKSYHHCCSLGAFTPHLKVLPCTPPSFFSIVPQIKWIDLLEEKISSNGTSGTYEPIDTMKTVKEDDESWTSLPLFEHLYQNVLLYA